MITWRTSLAALGAFSALGCARPGMPDAAVTALRDAERYELVSIVPHPVDRQDAGDTFHGRRVLGRAAVDDPAIRARVTEALVDSARREPGRYAGCFEPRHGVSTATRAGRTVDLVICFKCNGAGVIEDGRSVAGFAPGFEAEPTLDRVLRDAGVPLAPKE